MYDIKNNVSLLGYVGGDPEVRRLENGAVVAKFSLATSSSYKDRHGERQTQTEWHNIVAWGKTAELIEQIVKKGDELSLQGKLTYNSWEDNHGVKRTQAQVLLSAFHKHNKGKSSGETAAMPTPSDYKPTGDGYATNATGQVQVTDTEADDDLPF